MWSDDKKWPFFPLPPSLLSIDTCSLWYSVEAGMGNKRGEGEQRNKRKGKLRGVTERKGKVKKRDSTDSKVREESMGRK
jgi:hypothetical protein